MSVGNVLEIRVSFLGIHKWEPDIYIGFSLALRLQCAEHVQYICQRSRTLVQGSM
jgi:hypothetical protein